MPVSVDPSDLSGPESPVHASSSSAGKSGCGTAATPCVLGNIRAQVIDDPDNGWAQEAGCLPV
jgi:hypothetical protein